MHIIAYIYVTIHHRAQPLKRGLLLSFQKMNRFTVRVKDGEVTPAIRGEIYRDWAEDYDKVK